VAEHVVNAHPSVDEEAFKLDTGATTGGRTVDVTLYLDVSTEDEVTSPVRIETSLTGRNTPSGYTAVPCDPAPSG
jgi:hypothetical protein